MPPLISWHIRTFGAIGFEPRGKRNMSLPRPSTTLLAFTVRSNFFWVGWIYRCCTWLGDRIVYVAGSSNTDGPRLTLDLGNGVRSVEGTMRICIVAVWLVRVGDTKTTNPPIAARAIETKHTKGRIISQGQASVCPFRPSHIRHIH